MNEKWDENGKKDACVNVCLRCVTHCHLSLKVHTDFEYYMNMNCRMHPSPNLRIAFQWQHGYLNSCNKVNQSDDCNMCFWNYLSSDDHSCNGDGHVCFFLQIEYALSNSVEQTHKVCQEIASFMQDLLATSSINGRFESMDSKYAEFHLGDTYTWDHTTLQYVALSSYFLAARH